MTATKTELVSAIGAFYQILNVGDAVVYPVRRGSSLYLVKGVITDIIEEPHSWRETVQKLKVRASQETCMWGSDVRNVDRSVTVECLNRVVKLS